MRRFWPQSKLTGLEKEGLTLFEEEEEAMMNITEVSIIHHVRFFLFALWLLAHFSYFHRHAYFLYLIFIFLVLSDSEIVRWLNHAVEKILPILKKRAKRSHKFAAEVGLPLLFNVLPKTTDYLDISG